MPLISCIAVGWIAMLGFCLSSETYPCKENWSLIFHAPSGNGEEVLKAWKTMHNNCDIISGLCPCSISNGCLPPKARLETYKSTTKVLRSPFIDYWDCLNINKVKFELSVQGKTVAFIEFDGKGSNYLNWFNNSRILNSSSVNLSKIQTYSIFSIDRQSVYRRNFLISTSQGSCHLQSGFLIVKEGNESRLCEWDKQTTYPQFLYSKTGNATKWNNKEYGRADVLNIYVKIG